MEQINDQETQTPLLLDRIDGSESVSSLALDVRTGLTAERKELSPKYFYDHRGSELFEEITSLPEYYQTRTEKTILQGVAPKLAADYGFRHLVEFGSGNSEKTRVLLDALGVEGNLERYSPIDVSRNFLMKTSESLATNYPTIDITPVVGDFFDGLYRIDLLSPTLSVFLGGTIGNLYPSEATQFLRKVAEDMKADDAFLIGVDLVKDPAALHAAYNDPKGVTEEFNRNILSVINRELDGTFRPEEFYHYAFYNPTEQQIEMHLISRCDQTVQIGQLDLTLSFIEGESIMTEISRKFTRASITTLLESAGLELERWWTDPENQFGLLLARKT